MAKRRKAKSVKAYAIAHGDEIMIDSLESWTDEGWDECLRQLNRPAGQRVISVRITQIEK